MYFPKDYFDSLSNYKISLESTNTNNHQDSLFYTYDIDEGVQTYKTHNFTSNIDQLTINKLENLTKLFDLIEDGKVCMLNTFNTTNIYWVEDLLEIYSQSEEQLIITEADTQNGTSCSQQQTT
jgi:hypothetical protein